MYEGDITMILLMENYKNPQCMIHILWKMEIYCIMKKKVNALEVNFTNKLILITLFNVVTYL